MSERVSDETVEGAIDGTVVETVEIAAPPERVFDALTDPAEVAGWWRGGARELTVVDPPRRLEHRWRGDDRVRYDLEPATVDGAPGTRVTVTHERGGTAPAFTMRAARPAWARRRAACRR
ncbi:SRPBCC domain-containing protein [Roseisolibacter sp. H3M3-2]|uniref:SRPBCC family protein n=1 Tax=Roseisolibacter sp. H3M3-2 TaxID=3031323 RepID=UPI0023DA915B|nr:SRPBCC domain-containing protein [Roseisolibacter sp. H3M3-2]MDF1504684.1 SRPBCC domain-containing protein [Roseisolibacter sp. H3M3-2]